MNMLRQRGPALDVVTPPSWRPRVELATAVPIPVVVAMTVSTLVLETNLPKLWQVQVLLAPVAIAAYALLAPAEHAALRRMRVEPTLVALVVYMTMAVTWSHAWPTVANKTFLGLVMPILVVHVAAGLYEGVALVRSMATAGAVLAVFVFLDALARPGVAFSADDAGSPGSLGLRSIYYQKNSLGAALVLVMALRVGLRSRRVRIPYTLLLCVLLLLCKSSTSILSSIAVVSCQWLITKVARERKAGRAGSVFLGGGGAIIALLCVATLKDRVFELLGKNSTITGRDIIWSSTWKAAKEHLWFGYGTNGFWSLTTGPVSEVRHAVGFDVGSAHQGVIELILEYGVAGAIIFAVFLGTTIWRTASLVMRGDDSPVVLACVGFVVGIMVTTLTEAGFMRPGLMTLAFASGLLLTRERQTAATGYASADSTGSAAVPASSAASWRRW